MLLDALGISPSAEALYVGDRAEVDSAAALAAKMACRAGAADRGAGTATTTQTHRIDRALGAILEYLERR